MGKVYKFSLHGKTLKQELLKCNRQMMKDYHYINKNSLYTKNFYDQIGESKLYHPDYKFIEAWEYKLEGVNGLSN